jgi:hypothetical protein
MGNSTIGLVNITATQQRRGFANFVQKKNVKKKQIFLNRLPKNPIFGAKGRENHPQAPPDKPGV